MSWTASLREPPICFGNSVFGLFDLRVFRAGASNADPLSFHQFWEERNIFHYCEPYRSLSHIDDDLLRATSLPIDFDVVCTAERARGYKPDGTLFRYLIANACVPVPEILHSGQSQFTDRVGGKPLGLTVAWINRRNLTLHPAVPQPDHVLSDIRSLLPLLSSAG
jgi:hypothetical protein